MGSLSRLGGGGLGPKGFPFGYLFRWGIVPDGFPCGSSFCGFVAIEVIATAKMITNKKN